MSCGGNTFGERFLAEFQDDFTAEQIKRHDGVKRRRAAKVLLGVPWQFIPTERCEGLVVVDCHALLMLCCCLDDELVGAKPGMVSHEQITIAWTAAGHLPRLKRLTLKALQLQAMRQVLQDHSDLVVNGVIADRLARAAAMPREAAATDE